MKRKSKATKDLSLVFPLQTSTQFFRAATEKAPAKLRTMARKHAKEAIKHFTKDGWPLDLHFLESDMLYDIFGAHPADVFLSELGRLLPNKLEVVYAHKSSLVRLTKPKPSKKTATKKKAKK
jgi:hypothetical protein